MPLDAVSRTAQRRERVALPREPYERHVLAEFLERHEELLGLIDRAAQIVLGVDQEERGLDIPDVGQRRALDVPRRVFPGKAATALADVPDMADVAGAELGVDVADRPLRASRFESVGVRDRPVGHIAAVADADNAESMGVEERIAAEAFIETSHDVAEVASAPVADAGAAERLAVALTAARVRIDQNIPGPGVDLELVRVVIAELPVRSAMDPE